MTNEEAFDRGYNYGQQLYKVHPEYTCFEMASLMSTDPTAKAIPPAQGTSFFVGCQEGHVAASMEARWRLREKSH